MTEKTINPIQGTSGQLMVMAAHRYCLGRRSYIVNSCADWLKAYWGMFTQGTQRVIVRNTAEALIQGFAGNAIDVNTWQDFGQWAFERMSNEDQESIQRDCAHWQKPFPFTNNQTN